jgi:hypothetical protein
MNPDLALSWQVYPAIALMLLGSALVLGGLHGIAGRLAAAPRDPERAFVLMTTFRKAMIGVCLAAIGAGWLWSLPALVGLSLVILFEETLESTTVIGALSVELRRRIPVRVEGPAPACGSALRSLRRTCPKPSADGPSGPLRQTVTVSVTTEPFDCAQDRHDPPDRITVIAPVRPAAPAARDRR